MVQIITSKVNDPVDGEVIAVDPDDASKGTFTHYRTALNEVVMTIVANRTARVDGKDIKIDRPSPYPPSIMEGGNAMFNIVEVDSLPDGFKPNAFTYDGTSWAANPNWVEPSE